MIITANMYLRNMQIYANMYGTKLLFWYYVLHHLNYTISLFDLTIILQLRAIKKNSLNKCYSL